MLLSPHAVPEPHDAADALANAICHFITQEHRAYPRRRRPWSLTTVYRLRLAAALRANFTSAQASDGKASMSPQINLTLSKEQEPVSLHSSTIKRVLVSVVCLACALCLVSEAAAQRRRVPLGNRSAVVVDERLAVLAMRRLVGPLLQG